MSRNVHLCPLAELPDGGSRGFDPEGKGRHTLLVVTHDPKVMESFQKVVNLEDLK